MKTVLMISIGLIFFQTFAIEPPSQSSEYNSFWGSQLKCFKYEDVLNNGFGRIDYSKLVKHELTVVHRQCKSKRELVILNGQDYVVAALSFQESIGCNSDGEVRVILRKFDKTFDTTSLVQDFKKGKPFKTLKRFPHQYASGYSNIYSRNSDFQPAVSLKWTQDGQKFGVSCWLDYKSQVFERIEGEAKGTLEIIPIEWKVDAYVRAQESHTEEVSKVIFTESHLKIVGDKGCTILASRAKKAGLDIRSLALKLLKPKNDLKIKCWKAIGPFYGSPTISPWAYDFEIIENGRSKFGPIHSELSTLSSY